MACSPSSSAPAWRNTTPPGTACCRRIDPRVKVAGLLALVVAAALARNLVTLVALLGLAIAGASWSRLPLRVLATQVWLGALVLTLAIALPALVLTPGTPAFRLPVVGWTVTTQGVTTLSYLVLRVLSAATLTFLLVFTTPWTHVLKAFRVFRVPVVAVVVLGMTYRYILLLLEAAHDLFVARRSRTVGVLDGPERRRAAAAGIGVLLNRSLRLSHDVYLAMQARGFRGEVLRAGRLQDDAPGLGCAGGLCRADASRPYGQADERVRTDRRHLSLPADYRPGVALALAGRRHAGGPGGRQRLRQVHAAAPAGRPGLPRRRHRAVPRRHAHRGAVRGRWVRVRVPPAGGPGVPGSGRAVVQPHGVRRGGIRAAAAPVVEAGDPRTGGRDAGMAADCDTSRTECRSACRRARRSASRWRASS